MDVLHADRLPARWCKQCRIILFKCQSARNTRGNNRIDIENCKEVMVLSGKLFCGGTVAKRKKGPSAASKACRHHDLIAEGLKDPYRRFPDVGLAMIDRASRKERDPTLLLF